jgi:hypothetical protein
MCRPSSALYERLSLMTDVAFTCNSSKCTCLLVLRLRMRMRITKAGICCSERISSVGNADSDSDSFKKHSTDLDKLNRIWCQVRRRWEDGNAPPAYPPNQPGSHDFALSNRSRRTRTDNSIRDRIRIQIFDILFYLHFISRLG